MARIKNYTTLNRFGYRPVLTVDEVMAALGIDDVRKLPETYGAYWAVRK